MITKSLRVISEADAKGNKELVDRYWCTQCRIRMLSDNQSGSVPRHIYS